MTSRPPITRPVPGAALASAVVVLLSALVLLVPAPAEAGSTVTLRVTIDRVEQKGCTDSTDGSDFYADVTIQGQTFHFSRINDEDVLSNPAGWSAEKGLDVDAVSVAAVQVRLGEYDTGLNFGDDECDITNGGDQPLDLSVNLVPCSVGGDLSAPGCGSTLFATGSDEDDSAEVQLRIQVDEPGATGGIAVRCLHSPLWPQPGDAVTITAESLDGAIQVGDTAADNSRLPTTPAPPLVNRQNIADEIQVWVGDRASAKQVGRGKTTTTYKTPPLAAGTDLLYACRVKDGADSAFTGWRRVRVGPPVDGKAVPVIYTGDKKNRVDVVFVADMDNFTAARDAAFLSNVSDLLEGAYFGQDYFLRNQGDFNFWLADQRGDADSVLTPPAVDPDCVLTPPGNWSTDYTWADTGAILHTDRFRDCASGGVFSSEPDSLGTILHETGHSPFDLADEYCCDGGYFEQGPFPDLWDTLAECQGDAPSLGRVAGDCRTITDPRPDPDKDWFTSEPTPGDLMNADRRPPQAADIRRMDWYFGQCRDGQC